MRAPGEADDERGGERWLPTEAVLKAVRSRIRPIFMTTFTTVLGLLPLVVFPGAGSELYRGLGAVLLGGMLFSTFITLVQVPILLGLCLRPWPAAAAGPAAPVPARDLPPGHPLPYAPAPGMASGSVRLP